MMHTHAKRFTGDVTAFTVDKFGSTETKTSVYTSECVCTHAMTLIYIGVVKM